VKSCAAKGAGLQRVHVAPENPPDGNRSRMLLSNQKPSFLGISLRQQSSASSLKGVLGKA